MQFTNVIFFLLGLVSFATAGPSDLAADNSNSALVSDEDRAMYATHPDVALTPAIVAGLKEMTASLSNITARDETRTLMERNKSDILCADLIGAYGWLWALTGFVWRVIARVQSEHRVCPVNGRTCVAAGCDYNNCMVLCNDNPYFIQPDCGYLASYAADIIDRCNWQLHWGGMHVIGQRFDTDNYNVIVRGF
ncbi:hypothetical protein HYFRA_00013149 [Hymenoscyphus fraxineus]|uniref:Uncharacterized protein n=1 Tax=Hymenoscyphus fraxineus TaxID=746836 RepID=A0A9N9LAD5_9HELO|nr:hypothetical protein HYFRA_00013149 [Hymenoscyphus fraxineus]